MSFPCTPPKAATNNHTRSWRSSLTPDLTCLRRGRSHLSRSLRHLHHTGWRPFRFLWKQLLKQVRQESIKPLPRLVPQLRLLRILVGRDQISTARHDEQDVLEALGDGFLLQSDVSKLTPTHRKLGAKKGEEELTSVSPCPLHINLSSTSKILPHSPSIPSHSTSSTR